MGKTAFITGITGQDGSYLAELLLAKGYEVHGMKRRASSFNTQRVDHLYHDPQAGPTGFRLHYGDMTDATSIIRLIREIKPDEIYNLAAQSHVKVSFEKPEYTGDTDALGVLRLLEAIRLLKLEDTTRFYQASTSELYGLVQETPQTEKTPFHPRSPYAVAKLYGYWITVNYREAYNMFAVNGILFNHESPRRGGTFVTRKVTRNAARVALGLDKAIYIGNLDSRRDWGHAKDFVRAMWLMLQQDKPEDYVIATGQTQSVRDFIVNAFGTMGMTLEWAGRGLDEKGILSAVDLDRWSVFLRDSQLEGMNLKPSVQPGATVIEVHKDYFRPAEVDFLLGDPAKALRQLGWKPEIPFDALVHEMMQHDMAEAYRDIHLQNGGFKVEKRME